MSFPNLALMFGLSLAPAVGCGAAPEAGGDEDATNENDAAEAAPHTEPATVRAPSSAVIADPTLADLFACRIYSLPCPFESDGEDDEPLLLPPLPPIVDPVPAERLPGTALAGGVDGLDGRGLTESLTTR